MDPFSIRLHRGPLMNTGEYRPRARRNPTLQLNNASTHVTIESVVRQTSSGRLDLARGHHDQFPASTIGSKSYPTVLTSFHSNDHYTAEAVDLITALG